MSQRLFAILFSILICLTGNASPYREVFKLSRDWTFFTGTETSREGAPKVNLPHTWNTDVFSQARGYYRGAGNYLKDIDVPDSWRGRRVFIKCHGANTTSSVFVNGKHVGEHRAGYTSFCYEITDYLNIGRRNFLWIMVNNSPQSDVLPVTGDLNSYGGIFRDVELIVTGREVVSLTDHASEGVYITQKNVSSEKVEAEARVMINGVRDSNVTARVTIYDRDMNAVAENSAKLRLSGRTTSSVNVPLEFTQPELWAGTHNPYLYTVSVKILNDGGVTDSIAVRTGFRSVSVDNDGHFRLNGRPYRVKGVVVTQDWAVSGTAVTPQQVIEDFETIREMGANAVRVKGVLHHPLFYELCDTHGIIVWSDFPNIGGTYITDRSFINTHSFRENGELQAIEIIRQQFNRPCVVFWGIFSNMRMRGDNPTDYIANINLLTGREDPSRLTGANSNEDGELNFITDVIIWDHHFGWREGSPADIVFWKTQLHRKWNNLRSAISYSAGGSILHQDDSLKRPVYNSNWHPERWQTYVHEEYFKYISPDSLFWGIFVGNMFDYGASGYRWGEGIGVNDTGLVTFDRKYRKDAFYFYKANWNRYDDFVHIAESRRETRYREPHQFKVFSNRPDVELFVNGISQGTKKGVNGTFVWTDVELTEGVNSIEARSGVYTDATFLVYKDTTPPQMR